MASTLRILAAAVSTTLLLFGATITSASDSAEACRAKPVVVKIHADWCGSCKATKATWTRVQSDLGDVATVVELDVSDRVAYSESLAEAERLLESRDEYTAENVFWVPPEARWGNIQNQGKEPNIAKLIDDAMYSIERDNTKLKSKLPRDYARRGIPPERLGRLIDQIGSHPSHGIRVTLEILTLLLVCPAHRVLVTLESIVLHLPCPCHRILIRLKAIVCLLPHSQPKFA